MFRVVCIDDRHQYAGEPRVKKGVIYTVIRETEYSEHKTHGYTVLAGIYYMLLETGKVREYHSSLFIRLIEDQQDETEMQRDYETVKINNNGK